MDCIAPFYSHINRLHHYYWVIEGDIKGCFDHINHAILMREVKRRIADERILRLVNEFLKAGVMEGELFRKTEQGTPQGGIVSPLLANIYLHRFDEWWWEHYGGLKTRQKTIRRQNKHGNGIMVRYADDFVLLWNEDKAGAEKLREEARQFLLGELHLELSMEKTHITHASEGFDFLGFHVKRYEETLRIKPSQKNIERFKRKMRQMTCHSRGVDNEEHKFVAINRVLRGWINYFRNVSAKSTAIDLDWWVNQRVVRWLMHKHKKHIRWVLERYKVREQNEYHDRDNLAVKDSKGNRRYIYKMSDLPIRPYTYPFHRQNPYLERNDTTIEEIEIPVLDEMWDGASRLRDWRDVRAEVLERDGYRCQQCGSQDNLDVHHRQARYQGGDDSPENLVTLCEHCHSQTDTMGRPPSKNKKGGRQRKQD
jgi:group II intron reverse transcriptase/maturase